MRFFKVILFVYLLNTSVLNSQGPTISPFVPRPNDWVGCRFQQIFILIRDPDGVDPSSITLSINGVIYFFPDHMVYRGDTLVFTPTQPFSNGDTVEVVVLEARDNLGNPISAPLAYEFYIDLDYPFITSHFPPSGSTIRNLRPDIAVVIRDTTSGIAYGSVCFCLNVGTFVCDSTGSSGWCDGSGVVDWSGDTLIFHTGRLPYYFTEEGYIDACINHGVDLVNSDPRVCGPHSITASGLYCWRFIIDSLAPRASLVFPGFGDWVSCDSVVIRTIDMSGIDTNKIQMRVGDNTFYVHQVLYAWYRNDHIFYVPPIPFRTGDSIAIRILRIEDNVGNRAYSSSFPPWYFRVDKSPPYITSVSPAGGSFISSSSPIINIGIADSGSGVRPESLIVTINGTPFTTMAPPVRWSAGTLTINTGGLGYNFHNGDTVRVCVTRAIDRVLPENCGPNRMSNYCFYFVIDLAGPTATLISPSTGVFVACPYESIFIRVHDQAGIDPSTIRLSINGTIYDTSNGLRFRNDTLIFIPTVPWTNGDTIRFTLLEAQDRIGNSLSTPLSSYFIVDRQAPELIQFLPPQGSIFSDSTPIFSVRVRDALAGFSAEHSYIVIQGESFFPPTGFSFVGDLFSFNTEGRGIRFFDNESIRVCWYLYDNVQPVFCGPNVNYTCANYVTDFSPPTYTLILPSQGAITACANQQIRILLRDRSGIDLSSLRFSVNGVIYSIGANLGMRGDTLVFSPPSIFNNGDTVRFGITNIRDNLGNTGASGIIWYFVVDRTPPRLTGTYPADMDIVGERSPTISIYVTDDISGINGDSLTITVRGITYGRTSPGFSWDGTRIRFNTSEAGLVFANNETVQVCLTRAIDNISPLYCGPNRLSGEACFRFVVYLEGPTATLISPTDGSFIACLFQQIRILFSHPVVRESTEVLIGGVRYRYPEPHLQFRGDTLIFTPTNPWGEGTEIVVHIISAVDANGIPLATSPYWSFFADYSPPRIINISPSSLFLNSSNPTFRVVSRDNLSGVNLEQIRLNLNGTIFTITTPGISYYGDTIILNTLAAGINFRNGDTVRLCVSGLADNVPLAFCGPNRLDRDTCVTYMIDLEAPQAQLILPLNGSFTACARQEIRIRVTDFSGIELDSLRLRINGILYTRASPRIRSSGDTIIFTPASDWNNGDSISVELVSIYDRAGNPLSGGTHNWYFRVDRSPPVLWGANPPNFTLVSNTGHIIRFFISDSLSGTDTTSITVRARSQNYRIGIPGLTLVGNEIRFNPAAAGMSISTGDTIRFCAFGNDRVLSALCGPNRSDSLCTTIIYDLTPPYATLILPEPETYSSCIDQVISLQLYDTYGVNNSSISLNVNGINYTIYSEQITYNDSILTFTPTTYFGHNDTVRVSLLASDMAGNSYSAPLSWRFYIDTAPPTISSLQPAPMSFIGSADTISFTLSDQPSGVNWTSLRIDIGGFVFALGNRGIRRIGNRVSIIIDSLGLSFSGVETVSVCISATDNARYCANNRLVACYNYIFDLLGPTPRLVTPTHNSISACSTQQIIIAFSDPNGIVPTSITVRINGVNYTSSSPHVRIRDSTFIFTPSTRWGEGIINVQVLSVSDTLGNVSRMDYSWSFGIDLSPPYVLSYRPVNGSISGDSTGGIWIRLADNGSGVDPSSVRLTVNGVTYPYGSPGISWTTGIVRFNPNEVGVSFDDGETVRVTIVAADRPSYCAPNVMAPFSFWFTMDLAGPVVSLISPSPGYTSSCGRLNVRFSISDRSSIDTTSIIISVNGQMLGIRSPEVSYQPGTIIYEPRADFHDGDTVRVSVVRVNDIWSHNMSLSSSAATYYIIDRSPPYVVQTFPPDGTVTSDTAQTIWLEIIDQLSPIDPSLFIIEVNRNSYNYGVDTALSWNGRRLIFTPELAGLSFSDGETVTVCLVGAADMPDTCGPNYITEQFCFRFRIDISGPVARIISPQPGSVYSCHGDSQKIIVELRDPDGIIPDSIRFFVNGTRIVYGGPLSYNYPYLIYQPITPWRNGDTIIAELQYACDIFGNPLRLPLSWAFIVDTSPPRLLWTYPRDGELIANQRPNIRLVIVDSLAGINRNSVVITVNDSIYMNTRGLIWRGDTVYIPQESLRTIFSDGELVRVCVISAEDRAAGCEPNRISMPICFSFTIELGAPIVRPVSPLDGMFISCLNGEQRIRIFLFDRNGIDLSSLDFRVNGVRYSYGSYLLSYRDTILTFEPIGSPWQNGDTILVELRSVRDSLGNSLSTPLVYRFFVDHLPPDVEFDTTYGRFLGGRVRTARILITDNLSGVDTSSIIISVNGVSARIGERGISYVDSFCLLPIDSFGSVAENETILICVLSAEDNTEICPSNRLRNPVCERFIIDLSPPTAEIITPPIGTYSSCGQDSIIFRISDIAGLDSSRVRLSVNGRIYSMGSSELSYNQENGLIIFYPPLPFADGTAVEFALFGLTDILGNTLDDTLYGWYYIDISPPEIEPLAPTPVISDSLADIILLISDGGSGVDLGSLILEINGREFDISSDAIRFSRDSLIFLPEDASMVFSDGESVRVCVTELADRAELCGPNRIRHPYCFSFVVSLSGPIVNMLVPTPNSYVSCQPESQAIIFSIFDPDGVMLESVIIEINGQLYPYGSPQVTYRDGRIIFIPSTPFENGEVVNIRVVAAEDSLGNTITHPYNWQFTVDTQPPTITHIEPEPSSTEFSRTPIIRFIINDSIAGVRFGSATLTINGEIYNFSSGALTWFSDTLEFNTSIAGLSFSGGESVSVCLHIEDSTTVCAANSTDSCFFFFISALGPVARFIIPVNNEFVSCDSQWVNIRLYSGSGTIDTASIRLVYSSDTLSYGEPYVSYNPRDSILTVWPRTHYGGGEYITVKLIEASDELGNTLAGQVSVGFTIDITSPRLIYSSIRDRRRMSPPDSIIFVITDDISGLSPSSLRIRFDATEIRDGDPGISIFRDTIVIISSLAGLEFTEEEPFTICLRASDRAQYCGANSVDTCLTFTPTSQPPQFELVYPENGIFYNCERESIVVRAYDIDGILEPSIEVSVGDSVYRYIDARIRFDGEHISIPIFNIPSGETLTIRVSASDSIGNRGLSLPWFFISDISHPIMIGYSPDTITRIPDTISLVLADTNSGLDTETILISLNGSGYENLFVVGGYYHLDTVFIPVTESIGTYESLQICIRASDRVRFCSLNMLDTCVTIFINPEGPSAVLIEPTPLSYTSCDSGIIRIAFTNEHGVIPESLIVRINETIYTWGNRLMWLIYDTLVIYPSSRFSNGDTVTIEIVQAYDTLNNRLIRPIIFRFYVDLAPPVIVNASPLPFSETQYTRPDIILEIGDSLSGPDFERISIFINGIDYTRKATIISDSIIVYGDSLDHQFGLNDTIQVEILLCDNALYCGENCTTYSYYFICGNEGPQITPLIPSPSTFSSCPTQVIKAYCYDNDGIKWDSLRFFVKGIIYSFESEEINIIEDTVVYTPSTPFNDRETVFVHIDICDLYGNFSPAPLHYYFILDLTPPVITNQSPIGPVFTADTMLRAYVVDSGSGVNPESLIFLIEHPTFPDLVDTIKFGERGTYFHNGEFILNPREYNNGYTCGQFGGIWFFENETINVTVRASDMALYCGANSSQIQWSFVNVDNDTIGPTLLLFEPETVLDSTPFYLVVQVFDSSGVDSCYIVWDIDSSLTNGGERFTPLERLDSVSFRTTEELIPAGSLVFRVYIWDADTDCGILSDRSLTITDELFINIIPRLGPVATLIEPISGWYSSCERQRIIIRLTDPDGIDSESIVFTVNQETIYVDGVSLLLRGDSLIYIPPQRWSSGDTIRFALVTATDTWGNPLQNPIVAHFIPDLDPPHCILHTPQDSSYILLDSEIQIGLYDSLSGVNQTSLRIRINGQTYSISSSGISYSDGILKIKLNRLNLGRSSTILVELYAEDSPNICNPNQTNCVYFFRLEPEISCDVSPNPFTPNDDQFNPVVRFMYPHIETMEAELFIYDATGRLIFQKHLQPGGRQSWWDGKISTGKEAPIGSYIYIIMRENKVICKGSLILAR